MKNKLAFLSGVRPGANDLSPYDPTIWAQESLMVLEDNMVLGALVHRNFENIAQLVGDQINTRKPGTFSANDKGATADITIQDASATNVQIDLNKHKDVSFQVFDIEATRNFKDVIADFIEPALIAHADQVDSDIAALYSSLTNSVDLSSGAADIAGINNVRKTLNDQQVPFGPRQWVLGTQADSELNQLEVFHSAEKRGDTVGLQEASIGRKFGFNFWMDQNIVQTGTTPNLKDHAMAFHTNALALVTRPLKTAIPPDELMGARIAVLNSRGLGLRVTLAYDWEGKAVVVSIDILYGVKILDDNLATEVIMKGE